MRTLLAKITGTAAAFCLLAGSGAQASGQGHVVSSAAAQAIDPSDEAARNEQQLSALRAIDTGHLDEAHVLLDQLRAQDDKRRGLWATFALLNLREKDPSAGVYQPLAATLVQLHHRPEALEALRAWTAGSQEDPQPAGLLVGLLLEAGQPKEAVESGKGALAHLPPAAAQGDAQLQYALGAAQIRTGETTEGVKRLVQVLTVSDDPSTRNSVAYVLADAKLALPLAESTARQVVAQLELESEGWTLNGGPQPLQSGTPLLVAAWDTMGWVLFREGKPAAAEPYVRAAWRNELRSNVGQHLGEIEAALGRPEAAALDQRLATAAGSLEVSSLAVASAKPEPAPPKEDGAVPSTNAGGSARHSGAAASGADPLAVLQHLRTFPLGPSAERQEMLELRVLLSRGKIVAASPLTVGVAPPPGLSGLLAHANMSALFPVPDSFVQMEHLAKLQCTPRGCDLLLQP